MDDSYDDLVSRATKGDKAALIDLFAHAEKLNTEKRQEVAVRAFRDAAISYRIAAFRNLGRAEDAERRAGGLARVIEIYRSWIEANPKGIRQLPRIVPGINGESVRQVVIDDLQKDQAFAHVFAFLFETLSSLGMEFYSPGGSLERRVCSLLEVVFGLASNDFARYLEHSSVRVGIDLLADEVEKRSGRVQYGAAADVTPPSEL